MPYPNYPSAVPSSPDRLASEARKVAAFETSLDGILVTDQQGRILEVNPAAASAFGYEPEELIGREFAAALLPEPERERHRRSLSRYVESGEMVLLGRRIEIIALRADGREFPAELAITPVALDGKTCFSFFLQDTSERRQAEAGRRALAAIVESSDDAIIGKDMDGIITSWNRGAERLYGYTAAEVLGRPVSLLMPPERADDFPGIMGRLRRGEAIDHYETLRRTKDGRILTVSLSISLVRDLSGRLLGAAAIARDITRQKEEELIREQLRELERESQRIRAASRVKSEFLANMSHELRTPLNGIIGFAEFLADQKPGPLNAKQQEFLGDILNSAQHLLQLINDILDLSKVESGRMAFHPEEFSPADTLAEVSRILMPLAEKKRLQFRAESSPALPVVRLDPQKLKQVLYNLLSNAVKFTQPGGRIEAQLGPHDEASVELIVRDTGIGISAAELKKLFVEFHQIDTTLGRAHGGTGLGLALCKRIVELQGGTISVASEPGQGSTFRVVLPRQFPAT